jgi:hypothetical protein
MGILPVLKTRVFHQNACVVTNKWAAESIGQKLMHRPTESTGTNTQGGNLLGSQSQSQSTSVSRVYDYVVRPEKFKSLKTGGPGNRRIVEGYVEHSGIKFENGKDYLRTEFKQKLITKK